MIEISASSGSARNGLSRRQIGSKFSSTPFSRARAAFSPSSRPHSVGELKREEIKSSS